MMAMKSAAVRGAQQVDLLLHLGGGVDHCAHLRLLKRALTEEVLPAFH